MNRILHVRQEDSLFNDQPFNLVPPRRQAGFEPELREISRSVGIGCVACKFAPAELESAAVGRPELL